MKLIHFYLFMVLLSGIFLSCRQGKDILAKDVVDKESDPRKETQIAEQTLANKDLTKLRNDLEIEYQRRANSVINYFIRVQSAINDKRMQEALSLVDRCLYYEKTADALALKGTIYYMMGYEIEAAMFWKEAYEINPEAINLDLPGLHEVFPELKQ